MIQKFFATNSSIILASDYDRTFYVSDQDIQENKKMANSFMARGNVFIIATGRSFLDFCKKREQYELSYNFVILNHGATILDPKDNILFNQSISNKAISNIQADLDLELCESWFCCSALESRVDFEHKDITKINVKYSTKEKSLEVAKKINSKYNKYATAYPLSSNSIEIVSCKINKSKAIKWLIEFLGNIEKSNVFTIGDGHSDISMVQDFNGFCMEQSVEELKQVANGEYESVSLFISDILQHKFTFVTTEND